jgi:hypothetical protein
MSHRRQKMLTLLAGLCFVSVWHQSARAQQVQQALALLTSAFACPVPPEITVSESITSRSLRTMLFSGDADHFAMDGHDTDRHHFTSNNSLLVSERKYSLSAKYSDITRAEVIAPATLKLTCATDRSCVAVTIDSNPTAYRNYLARPLCDRETADNAKIGIEILIDENKAATRPASITSKDTGIAARPKSAPRPSGVMENRFIFTEPKK